MMRLDPALSDEGPNGEESVTTVDLEKAMRNLSTTMGHSTGLIREQCPVW